MSRTSIEALDDDHPLWLINAQIDGLLEGLGASEDHEAVLNFLRKTGLPELTVKRMHKAIVHGEAKSFLTGDIRRIAACVKALEGLNDDALIGGWSFRGIEAYAKGLAAERDALLAEKNQNDFALLKAMLEIFDIMGNPVQFRAALEMAVEKRATAIASVKSNTPDPCSKCNTPDMCREYGRACDPYPGEEVETSVPAIVFYPAGSLGEYVDIEGGAA